MGVMRKVVVRKTFGTWAWRCYACSEHKTLKNHKAALVSAYRHIRGLHAQTLPEVPC